MHTHIHIHIHMYMCVYVYIHIGGWPISLYCATAVSLFVWCHSMCSTKLAYRALISLVPFGSDLALKLALQG